MDGTKLGKRIKQLRIEKDLQQDDLADLFGFSGYQQISKWEAGRLLPSMDQLRVLSDKLEANLFEVLADIYKDYSLSKVNSHAHADPPVKKEEVQDLDKFSGMKSRLKASKKVEHIPSKPDKKIVKRK